jgi:hypothetical protein
MFNSNRETAVLEQRIELGEMSVDRPARARTTSQISQEDLTYNHQVALPTVFPTWRLTTTGAYQILQRRSAVAHFEHQHFQGNC